MLIIIRHRGIVRICRRQRVRSGRIWPPAAEAFPRIIDGNQSPAATPRPVTPSRRPASGYVDRQRHAEWLGGTGRTLAEPPFGAVTPCQIDARYPHG
jgi:hypothetical protein